ncbi:MAG: hypothetical protein J6T96_03085 [Bacteroidales bacterium]|nr:hypothetical protein [Bacteroidales bacterium]
MDFGFVLMPQTITTPMATIFRIFGCVTLRRVLTVKITTWKAQKTSATSTPRAQSVRTLHNTLHPQSYRQGHSKAYELQKGGGYGDAVKSIKYFP